MALPTPAVSVASIANRVLPRTFLALSLVLTAALGGCLFFRESPWQHQGPQLRILCWRLGPGPIVWEAVEETIRDWNPTIVVLQDVPRAVRSDNRRDRLLELSGKLETTLTWLGLESLEPGASGLAILTPGQATNARQVAFDRPGIGLPRGGTIGLDVPWNDETIRVWNVYLADDGSGTTAYVQTRLLESLGIESDKPALLVGYFGVPPTSVGLGPLKLRWRDAWRWAGSGQGYTSPAGTPKKRLSYVWVPDRGPLRVTGMQVVGTSGGGIADAPVIVDFALQPEIVETPEAARDKLAPPPDIPEIERTPAPDADAIPGINTPFRPR